VFFSLILRTKLPIALNQFQILIMSVPGKDHDSNPDPRSVIDEKKRLILFVFLVMLMFALYNTSNMRQVQPETLPKHSNFSSCLQNTKLKNNTTENFGFLAADDHNE
jgi:hypothetical protein